MAHKLETKNLTMKFADRTIISDISIAVDQGELVSLLGVSGSGKTTLFNCIAGIYTPVCGSVILDGEDITGKTGYLSYMLQKDLLLPYKTIEDNVALPLIIRGAAKNEARAAAREHFAQFGLEGTEKMYPKQLSGGMRQRAALLRTYLFSDNVALLDEPFSALDTITKSKIHKWYLDVMDEIKLTTVFITHDINEAILLSDRIYIMSGKPGVISSQIRIAQPRNQRQGFDLSDEFMEYKRQIIELLGDSDSPEVRENG
ncbi:MAG: ABC transporter ATP-binding protein [Bacillota bacterium]|nr:ABC transporter ATP-binding protein [Bacillota bacterium]